LAAAAGLAALPLAGATGAGSPAGGGDADGDLEGGITVVPHVGDITDQSRFPPDWWRQFSVVLGGFDNVEARRFANSMLCSFVKIDEDGAYEDLSQVIPFVNGGTEGFQGSVNVILPRVTACFECLLDTFPPETTVPVCTIANTPRKPEHCVLYVLDKEWAAAFPERAKPDTDSPEDMRWVFEHAAERARAHRIEGVTYAFTLGVAKKIIPAIASTNALVAATCVHEALKYITRASQTLDNWLQYAGGEGVAASALTYARTDGCAVCCKPEVEVRLPRSAPLEALVRHEKLRLRNAEVFLPGRGRLLEAARPGEAPAAAERRRDDLARSLADAGVEDGDELAVHDRGITRLAIAVTVRFE
jgi:ubiquitin-activating enzyme E1 C